MSFSSYIVSNFCILIVALLYWEFDGAYKFSKYCFWLGFISSSFHTIGCVGMTKAYSIGPGGPVAAICGICNVGLVFVEAVKHWKWLSNLQSIGVLFGIFGSAMLVVPDVMEKYFMCCFF
jgi:hypothetical protein